MQTCPCKVYPLTPHFYIEKLGFTGVFIIFLFLDRLRVVVRTASINVFSKNKKKIAQFSSENYLFNSREILLYVSWACFRNV